MEHSEELKWLVFQVINFAIFGTILFIAARKPLAAMAAKRRSDYDSRLIEATEAKRVAEKNFAELTERFRSLEGELSKIKSMTAEASKAASDRIVADAQKLAEHIKIEAKRTAETEIENAKQAIRKEIVAAAKAEVEKKLAAESAEGKRSLIQSQIAKISNMRVEV